MFPTVVPDAAVITEPEIATESEEAVPEPPVAVVPVTSQVSKVSALKELAAPRASRIMAMRGRGKMARWFNFISISLLRLNYLQAGLLQHNVYAHFCMQISIYKIKPWQSSVNILSSQVWLCLFYALACVCLSVHILKIS